MNLVYGKLVSIQVQTNAAVITDKYFSVPATNGSFLSIINFYFILETSKLGLDGNIISTLTTTYF
jgi:hypothetical protein